MWIRVDVGTGVICSVSDEVFKRRPPSAAINFCAAVVTTNILANVAASATAGSAAAGSVVISKNKLSSVSECRVRTTKFITERRKKPEKVQNIKNKRRR